MIPSTKKLNVALDSICGSGKVPTLYFETYGKKTCAYVAWTYTGVSRVDGEAALAKLGIVSSPTYHPGSQQSEVQVGFRKTARDDLQDQVDPAGGHARSSSMTPEALLEKAAKAAEVVAQEMVDDERSSFTFEEATEVSEDVGVHVSTVIKLLKSYGFAYVERPVAKHVRGFTTSSNDRYFGPGSSKSHGGSGHEQIAGWAGQKG